MNKFGKICLTMALVCGFGASAMAGPGDVAWPTTQRAAKAFVQTIPGDAWQKMMISSINPKFLIGKPIVLVFNPYDEEIQNVVCDGQWSLVGPTATNKSRGAPESIAPHTVAFIPTESFDNYCKSSIVALTEDGSQHKGQLNIPGNFTDSTMILFPAE